MIIERLWIVSIALFVDLFVGLGNRNADRVSKGDEKEYNAVCSLKVASGSLFPLQPEAV